MKRLFIVLLFIVCFISAGRNRTHFELGSPIYRDLCSSLLFGDHWHGGMFMYFDYTAGNGTMKFIEMDGISNATRSIVSPSVTYTLTGNWNTFEDELHALKDNMITEFVVCSGDDAGYQGAYYNHPVGSSDEYYDALTVALAMDAQDPDYTWDDMIKPGGISYDDYVINGDQVTFYSFFGGSTLIPTETVAVNSCYINNGIALIWEGLTTDIYKTRCDGVVEFCLEKAGIPVSRGVDISEPIYNNLVEHNDLHTWEYNDGELCPKIQSGEQASDSDLNRLNENPPEASEFTSDPDGTHASHTDIQFQASDANSEKVWVTVYAKKTSDSDWNIIIDDGGVTWKYIELDFDEEGDGEHYVITNISWDGLTINNQYSNLDQNMQYRIAVVDQGANYSANLFWGEHTVTLSNRNASDGILGGYLSFYDLTDPSINWVNLNSGDRLQCDISHDFRAETMVQDILHYDSNTGDFVGLFTHNNWDNLAIDFRLSKNYPNFSDYLVDANFDQKVPINFESNIEGVEIMIQDPWYVRNDGNKTQTGEDWVSVDDEEIGSKYFIGQNENFSENYPIYSLKAPKYYATTDGIHEFQQWQGNDILFPDGSTTSNTNRITEIVFTSDLAEINAIYDMQNPVNLEGNPIVIEEGDYLLIPSNAMITFVDDFEINIEGIVMADGSNGGITFTGSGSDAIIDYNYLVHPPEPTSWLFNVNNPNASIKLKNVIINNTYGGVSLSDFSSATFENVTISGTNQAINVGKLENDDIIFSNVHINNSTNGIVFPSGFENTTQESHILMFKCVFSNIDDYGIFLFQEEQASWYSHNYLSFAYCTFHDVGNSTAHGGSSIKIGQIAGPEFATIVLDINSSIFSNTALQLQPVDFFSEIRNLVFECSGYSQHFSHDLITGNPQFVDQDNGDFHLTSGSPAIDMGSTFQFELLYAYNGYQPFWIYDYDGDPDDTEPDIGAKYFHQMNGAIDSDITLSGGASLSSNTTVPIGVTLTIDQDTQIDVAQDAQLIVNGQIHVNGTNENPVVFQPTEAGGTWHGIKIDGGGAFLDYVDISNVIDVPAIDLKPGIPFGHIRNCNVHDNDIGIKYASQGSIENNNIYDNKVGIMGLYANSIISDNHIYNNEFIGIALFSGSNSLINGNDIHGNGSYLTSGSMHHSGILSFNSAPSLTMNVPINVAGYPINNKIYENDGRGFYSTFTGIPNLGEYYTDDNNIYGGFNQIYGNTNNGVYRNMNGIGFTSYLKARANYWNMDSSDPNVPTDAFDGYISVLPTAPEILPEGGVVIDPNTDESGVLIDAVHLEEQELFEPAIEKYTQYVNFKPDRILLQVALNGLDRCNAKLGLVDPWITLLEDIAHNFPDVDQKDLAKTYLMWEYKKQKLDAEAIALAEELIESAAGTDNEDYYTMEMAMLIDNTEGTILLRQSPELAEITEKVRQAEERLLTEFADSEPAQLYSLLFNKKSSESKTAIVPDEFALYPAYPSPFNPTTNIKYDIPLDSRVTIMIYDVLGRAVTKLVGNKLNSPGNYKIQWHGVNSSGKPVSSGMYFYQIQAEVIDGSKSFTSAQKMILLK